MSKVAVIGFGVTGRAVAKALLAADDQVVVFDDHPSAAAVSAGRALGLTVEQTPDRSVLASRLGDVDLVIPSPGVPVGHAVYGVAEDLHIEVASEIELAYGRIDRPNGPRLVAITGTNGKTTVTTLVTAILVRAGVEAVSAGNIGTPLIEAADGPHEIIVAEVSSFQLQYTRRFRPDVSCWLNLAPDHLDWHPTHDHYRQAKAKVWANQGPGDTAVYNTADPDVRAEADGIPTGVDRIGFSAVGDAHYSTSGHELLGPDGLPIMPVDELPRRFPHDIANALAAVATAIACGADSRACRSALASAPVLAHRVALVGEFGGRTWYDDSKATTPASVLAAVEGLDSVVLIAGGRNKGLDLSVLSATVPPVRAVVAIGEASEEVRTTFAGLVPVEVASDMESAVRAADRLANNGDAVLLSPGCASFDWYSSYAERGEHFASLVTSIFQKGGAQC